MEDILIGILLLLAGLSLTFAGLRVFLTLLPVFGFISGFFLGASVVAGWLDESFLGTVLGWIVGILLGLLFAALSYLYWYIGAILSAASAGAILAMGLLTLFGVDSTWAHWIAAAIGGAVLGLLALLARLPIYMVLFSTALGGATMVVASLLLLFDQVELGNLEWGAWYTIETSWFWWIVEVLLAGAGIAVQWSRLAMVQMPAERWIRADAAARQSAAVSNDRETRGR